MGDAAAAADVCGKWRKKISERKRRNSTRVLA
jgi:hypothetical protein